MKAYSPYINIARCLAMFMVILGHVDKEPAVVNTIYSFHMALFFLLSGMIWRPYRNIRELTYKKFFSLIVPFIFFYLLTLAFYWIIEIRFRPSTVTHEWNRLVPLLYGSDIRGWMSHNVVLWFLPALFTTEIVFNIICNKVSDKYLQELAVVGISGIGFIMARYHIWFLPWGLSQAMVMLLFYYLGTLFKPLMDKITNRDTLIDITMLLLAAFIFFVYKVERYDVASGNFGNIANFIATSLCGSGVIIFCSALIRKNWLLELFGKGDVTIVALGLQGIVYRPLKLVCDKTLIDNGLIGGVKL